MRMKRVCEILGDLKLLRDKALKAGEFSKADGIADAANVVEHVLKVDIDARQRRQRRRLERMIKKQGAIHAEA